MFRKQCSRQVRLSVGVTCHPDLFELDGLFSQGSRPGRSFVGSVGGTFTLTVLIGRTAFDTKTSISDPTLSLSQDVEECKPLTDDAQSVVLEATEAGAYTRPLFGST